jgi:glyoxylase-like metal-dependent hydrolase (beta-lactamase superfamily II)
MRSWQTIRMDITTVLAPNPGSYTGPGTNSYVLTARDEALIIDPGPEIDSHLAALRKAIEGRRPIGIAVTHTHPDHAPAANPLAAELDVPAYGPGPGPGFLADAVLTDGDTVSIGNEEIQAIATPGHTPDHLCYLTGGALFTGDHIMGGSTVVIEDLATYLESLRKLQQFRLDVIYPGHGPVIDDPQAVITDYINHRLDRERQILAAINGGAGTVIEIVDTVYVDLDPALRPAAAHSVGAHLRKLADEGIVEFGGQPDVRFTAED